MAIAARENAFVGSTSTSISLSQMFTVTTASSNPAYVVLSLLDRNEYTAGASGATGRLSGNGNTSTLTSVGGDGRGTGIIFRYQVPAGRYYNSTFGYLDELTYTSSSSVGDVTSLSLFGTSDLSLATQDGANPYSMIEGDAPGYLGSTTVVTRPNYSAAVPSPATPNSIAATADSLIGQAWNRDGCWTLASTIAAEAGASLPVQSTLIGLSGQANGEWIVAFNGPTGQSGDWQSTVTAGEMIVIGTPGGGGHITTCVSGSGSTALLVDNIAYVNGQGQVLNSANDGSSSDIIVVAPHSASQEWSGVQASSVVIYELDTPVVSTFVTSDTLALHSSQSLVPLFSAFDPGNRLITSWQVYGTALSDWLVVSGVSHSNHSAGSTLTTSSLGLVSLLAGGMATTDTLEVRAYNGLYWGDWQSLSVTIGGLGSNSTPVLLAQTPNQSWVAGKAISLALPAGTFMDPQNQTLGYAANLSNGNALPAWLTFNAANQTFSGIAPTALQTLAIAVTANDSIGLTATETFSATILGVPVVTNQTGNQTWREGGSVSLTLPANTFTDPQSQALNYSATLANGQALPSWLSFNAKTEAFSGTVSSTAQVLNIEVTATDAGGLAVSETFSVNVRARAATNQAGRPGISVSNPTPHLTWTDGLPAVSTLSANTFTDALGLKMTFAASELGGPNVTSWLHFDPTADAFSGTPPTNFSGTATLAVLATDAQHMMALDLFDVTFVAGSGHIAGSAASTSAMGALDIDPAIRGMLLPFHD